MIVKPQKFMNNIKKVYNMRCTRLKHKVFEIIKNEKY